MKSNKIKQLAVKGLVNGKLKLGRVRPKSIGFFWNKGVTMYGAPRLVMMSELELKLVYNKDNFIELPAVWEGMTESERLSSQEIIRHGSEVMSAMMTTMHGKLYINYHLDGDTVSEALPNEPKDLTLSAIPLKAMQRKGDYSPFCYAVVDAIAKDKNYPIFLSPELEGESKPFINCDDASSIYNNLTLEPAPITEEELQWHKTSMHDLFTPEELAEQWEEDNTFLLNTATTYYINIAEGYILIDNRKYKFELEDVGLRLDVDGDWVSTHVESKNLVCYANTSIGTIIYKEIKILGEL